MRNQYKVLAEKYQAINEDVAKTGFDRFAEVYEKINTAVKTLDRLYKEYNKEIEPLRDRFQSGQIAAGSKSEFADAIKSLQTSFTKKHNLQEYFETILEGKDLSKQEKVETLSNLYGAIFFHITDRVHVRKWVTAMLINKTYVDWYSV